MTAQGLATAREAGRACVRLYQPLFNGSTPLLVSPPAAVVLALLDPPAPSASGADLNADPTILIRINEATPKLGDGLSALEAAPAYRAAPDGSYILLHRPGAPRLLRTHLMSNARVWADAEEGAQHDASAGCHWFGRGGGGGGGGGGAAADHSVPNTAGHSVPLLLPSDGTLTPIGKLDYHLPQVAADSAGASSASSTVVTLQEVPASRCGRECTLERCAQDPLPCWTGRKPHPVCLCHELRTVAKGSVNLLGTLEASPSDAQHGAFGEASHWGALQSVLRLRVLEPLELKPAAARVPWACEAASSARTPALALPKLTGGSGAAAWAVNPDDAATLASAPLGATPLLMVRPELITLTVAEPEARYLSSDASYISTSATVDVVRVAWLNIQWPSDDVVLGAQFNVTVELLGVNGQPLALTTCGALRLSYELLHRAADSDSSSAAASEQLAPATAGSAGTAVGSAGTAVGSAGTAVGSAGTAAAGEEATDGSAGTAAAGAAATAMGDLQCLPQCPNGAIVGACAPTTATLRLRAVAVGRVALRVSVASGCAADAADPSLVASTERVLNVFAPPPIHHVQLCANDNDAPFSYVPLLPLPPTVRAAALGYKPVFEPAAGQTDNLVVGEIVNLVSWGLHLQVRCREPHVQMSKLLLHYSVGLPPLEVGLDVTCGGVLHIEGSGVQRPKRGLEGGEGGEESGDGGAVSFVSFVDPERGSLAIQVGETAAHQIVGAWKGAHVSASPTAEDADAQIEIEIADAAADAAAAGVAPLQPNRTLSLRGVRPGLVRLALRVEPLSEARRLVDISSVSSADGVASGPARRGERPRSPLATCASTATVRVHVGSLALECPSTSVLVGASVVCVALHAASGVAQPPDAAILATATFEWSLVDGAHDGAASSAVLRVEPMAASAFAVRLIALGEGTVTLRVLLHASAHPGARSPQVRSRCVCSCGGRPAATTQRTRRPVA